MRTEFTEGIKSSGLDRKLSHSLVTINSFKLFPYISRRVLSISIKSPGYFNGKYRKVCPGQIIDQKLRLRHHINNFKRSLILPINFAVGTSTMKHPNSWTKIETPQKL